MRRPIIRIAVIGAALSTLSFTVVSATSGASMLASGGSKAPIEMGVITPLSGPYAAIGRTQLYGIKLAVQQVNKAGGADGRTVKIVPKDSKATPTTAAGDIRELIEQDHVTFVVGPAISSPTAAALPIATAAKELEDGTTVVTTFANPSKYPYYFQMVVDAKIQGETFVQRIKAEHYSKIAIIADNDAQADAQLAVIKKSLPSGSTIVTIQSITPTTTNETAQMNKLESSNPDVLLDLQVAAPDIIATLQARTTMGWKVPVLGLQTEAAPTVVKAVGAAGLNGVYAGQMYKVLTGTPSKKIKKFLDDVRSILKTTKITTTASSIGQGYDCAMVFLDAVNATHSTDTETLVHYIESHTYHGILATYHFSKTSHNGVSVKDYNWVLASSFTSGLFTAAPTT